MRKFLMLVAIPFFLSYGSGAHGACSDYSRSLERLIGVNLPSGIAASTLYFPDGKLALLNDTWHFDNGNLACINDTIHYSNGNLAYINRTWYFSNGSVAEINGTWYYGNGQLAFINGTIYYSNGTVAGQISGTPDTDSMIRLVGLF